MNIPDYISSEFNRLGTKYLSPPHGGRGYFRNHGDRTKLRIALTFDDGPSMPCTEELLDVMGELNVQGSFFMVGVNMAWHPQIVKRAFDEGHDIGNHSMLHSRKAGLVPIGSAHIECAENEIWQITGKRPRLYRPPWGWLPPWEGKRLIDRGYTVVGWDVYTLDWHWPEEDGIVVAEQAIRDTLPGSILLFHDANAGVKDWSKKETTRAIKHLVPILRDKGYEIVPASSVLEVSPYA